MNEASPATWLTTEEAADVLGVDKSRIRHLIAEKKLTARKRAGAWFIDPASITAYGATERKAGWPKGRARK